LFVLAGKKSAQKKADVASCDICPESRKQNLKKGIGMLIFLVAGLRLWVHASLDLFTAS
jgi:hypothetical protein